MEKIIESARVWVSTRDLEGMATVLYVAKNEIYPVQIETDAPDGDGHRVHRVAYSEIHEQQPEKTVPDAVPFSAADDPVRYIGKVIEPYKPYGYKVGDMYVLGVVASSYRPGPATIYSVWEFKGLRFCGCMGSEIFEIVGEYKEVEVVPEPVVEQEPEQLSLFDF